MVHTPKNDSFPNRLSRESKKAVEKLCRAGCDRVVLLDLFTLLAFLPEPAELPPHRLRQGTLKIGPRDDWKRLTGKLGMEGIRAIERRAQNLISDVDRLRRTPLVAKLRSEERFQPDGLLGSQVPMAQSRLSDLLALPDLARQCQPGSRPSYMRNLKNIYQYIHDKTGRWYDREMAQILYDITPDGPSQDSLKEGRCEQGLTRAKR